MSPYTRIEISVGAFVIVGALALGYLAFTLGGLKFDHRDLVLSARFSTVGELKVGDPVKIAGVSVGQVERIRLVDFGAEAQFALDHDLKLPADTIASIESAGLLGDSYVALSPGGSDRDLAPGARITRTEPAISLSEIIAKYAFGENPVQPAQGAATPPRAATRAPATPHHTETSDDLDLD